MLQTIFHVKDKVIPCVLQRAVKFAQDEDFSYPSVIQRLQREGRIQSAERAVPTH
jgi:hypothetical protein